MSESHQNYSEFLISKAQYDKPSGFDLSWPLSEKLFPFQAAIVRWCLKRGRAAVFADTGLGKSFIQSAWAEAVHQYTGNRVLIVAPLCVAQQTVREAEKLGITIKYAREFSKETGIYITNYEMIENFREGIENNFFDGVVLDESSIIKHQDGKTRAQIIDLCSKIPFRLSCTATPSPNDFMELGSQAEFLGVMTQVEMLSMFFIHDSAETSKWRLKGHGKDRFWEWLSTWSIFIKKPSDIGFSAENYNLPELKIEMHSIGERLATNEEIFGIQARQQIKRETVNERVAACADLVNLSVGPFVVWCHRNDESEKLAQLIPDAVEIKGSDKLEKKEKALLDFADGRVRVLITKPKIAGFGLNWQHCNQMAFVGLSDSYEQIYQAIRRCWRFGQTRPVTVTMIAHAAEGPVLENIQRKEKQADEMATSLIEHMRAFQEREVKQLSRQVSEYKLDSSTGKNFTVFHGDCVEVARTIESDTIDYSIFSPPFASLYTYSNSDRDMGNSKNYHDFWIHFGFLIDELIRIMRPGRNISVHCMNLTTSKQRDGVIGIRDFRGDVIREFQKRGFIYHSEVCIWKDPVVAMQRTKALGLLWKQIKKDSAMNRQGLPDYVVTFRKPGVNAKPICHTAEEFPVDKWQHYASPVWFDIKQSNTLNGRIARDKNDERHIAPLQLDLIERCIDLWSAKDDLIFSPFTGVGSEGVISLKMNRRFIGSELKKSYFDIASKFLHECETSSDNSNSTFAPFILSENPRTAAVNFHNRKLKTVNASQIDQIEDQLEWDLNCEVDEANHE